MDLNPESWRRCQTCFGKLVRVTSQKQLGQHQGHRFQYAEGFHINEYLRILIGLL